MKFHEISRLEISDFDFTPPIARTCICPCTAARGGRLAARFASMAARAVEGFASQDVVGPASPSVLPDVVCEPTAPYACLPCFDEDLVSAQRV